MRRRPGFDFRYTATSAIIYVTAIITFATFFITAQGPTPQNPKGSPAYLAGIYLPALAALLTAIGLSLPLVDLIRRDGRRGLRLADQLIHSIEIAVGQCLGDLRGDQPDLESWDATVSRSSGLEVGQCHAGFIEPAPIHCLVEACCEYACDALKSVSGLTI